ncbi:uncharacterized protein LOC100842788 isoform X1 [Brachypodium distachyon]|uniref:uncharacterized protein LOC100842788 isoform X1 n=1 Tax=Brachypodium distachyon TaxID=15368 RepID=UPI000D0D26D4|nr:uncharacterized protein LOC100842788 isoform X1 [Brachypodium distachyon]|eukprot:XP_024319025.1 uncharacterized protein LOC100842788 isoform X1 [Brachypodium distachyon]
MRGDGDKEAFFHCLDRVPSGIHIDADFPSDDDDDDENGRASFSSAMPDQAFQSFRKHQAAVLELDDEEPEPEEEMEDASKYDMWMSDEPMSIQERRRRLHQGLGMVSSRDLALRRHSTKKRFVDVPRSVSRRMVMQQEQQQQQPQPLPTSSSLPAAADAPSTTTVTPAAPLSGAAAARDMLMNQPPPAKASITRRRSDTFLAVRDGGTPGSGKPQLATSLRCARSLLSPHDPCSGALADKFKAAAAVTTTMTRDLPPPASSPSADKGDDGSGKKQQDSSKEVVPAAAGAAPKDQSQTGAMGLEDQFEKLIGNTPIVKHLMRRGQSQHHSQPLPPATGTPPPKGDNKAPAGKKKGGWLKNIKSVAIGFIGDKDGNVGKSSGAPAAPTTGATAPGAGPGSGAMPPPSSMSSSSSSAAASTEKLKVHNYGKSSKELTGLYMSQEVKAHEGSIWSIKFSADGRRLASAGEDGVVRVWEVVETSAPPGAVPQDGSLPPLPCSAADGSSAAAPALTKKSTTKAGKTGKDALPEHLVVPDKVFALAEPPLCVLEGHEDDVLDLTWSKSDQLLSSSMDKTVRLWDTTSKGCLKTFSHSDYVTTIQFNPVDDRYFISGSLDAKVRLWSIPNRQVVDWTDVNEMVTAASYSPDGQGAIIGSHQGSSRFYKTADCKLSAEAQIDIQSKKRKSQAKKITGFQVPHILIGSLSWLCSSIVLAHLLGDAAVLAGEPVGGAGDVGGLADPGVRRRHHGAEVQGVQEHEQPDRGGVHERRSVRGVRQRGLARLRLEDHPERAGRGARDRRHRHEAQDLVHHPLLRELLLQGRLRRRALAPLPGPTRQPLLAEARRRVVHRRHLHHGEPRGVGEERRACRQPRGAASAAAVAALGPARHAVVEAGEERRRGGRRQRVGAGGGDGDPGRRDQGVPELRHALQDQRPGQPLPLIP